MTIKDYKDRIIEKLMTDEAYGYNQSQAEKFYEEVLSVFPDKVMPNIEEWLENKPFSNIEHHEFSLKKIQCYDKLVHGVDNDYTGYFETFSRFCQQDFLPEDITGDTLLNSLTIKESSDESEFTNKEILEALERCQSIIKPYCDEDLQRTFSISVDWEKCIRETLIMISTHNFNEALKKLKVCIADGREDDDHAITKVEYILYDCIISCFIETLKQEEQES